MVGAAAVAEFAARQRYRVTHLRRAWSTWITRALKRRTQQPSTPNAAGADANLGGDVGGGGVGGGGVGGGGEEPMVVSDKVRILGELQQKLSAELPPGAHVVSNAFPFPKDAAWTEVERRWVEAGMAQGTLDDSSQVYLYRVERKEGG